MYPNYKQLRPIQTLATNTREYTRHKVTIIQYVNTVRQNTTSNLQANTRKERNMHDFLRLQPYITQCTKAHHDLSAALALVTKQPNQQAFANCTQISIVLPPGDDQLVHCATAFRPLSRTPRTATPTAQYVPTPSG